VLLSTVVNTNTSMVRPTTTSHHQVRFFRSTDEPGLHKAVCTCGWSMNGDLETLQTRAATHDLDTFELDTEPPIKGFVSGLPDPPWGK
jgi:hypothetical protein